VVLDRAHCEACGTCVAACPARALAFEGETHTLTYAFTECLKDQDFYEESGGGVTLSGGEALLQPHFVRALVERLHQAGVHVAIETTGYIAPALWHELAPLFDLVLFDVKHGDAAAHAKGTGVSNEQILDNLAWAFAHGLTVLPRVPVIPGFNNTPAAAASIAQAIRQAGGTRAQVLPFHQLGERKYELLGRAYSLAGERALTQEDLAPFCEAAAAAGLETFF
jgi:pyruvate formate lyase activating enzyme